MLDKLCRLLQDGTVDSPSVLNARFTFEGGINKETHLMCDCIVEMLFGILSEQMYSHLSGIRDYPRGMYASLTRALKRKCNNWVRVSDFYGKCLATKDQNDVPCLQTVESCQSLKQKGIQQYTVQSVSVTLR